MPKMSRAPILVTALLAFGASLPAQSQQTFGVNTSDGTVRVPSLPPQPPQFDLNSLPLVARQRRLTLYQREFALLQELSGVKWQALGEALGGLAAVGSTVIASPTGATSVAEDSAARSGQYGSQFRGVNAAVDAERPAEMYASVNRAMQLLVQIDLIDKQISTVQHDFGIDPALRSPWVALFPSSTKQLTPAEVRKLLEPAAQAAAKPADPRDAQQADGIYQSLLSTQNQALAAMNQWSHARQACVLRCTYDDCMKACPSCNSEQESASKALDAFSNFNAAESRKRAGK